MGGKREDGSPDAQLLSPLIDTRNTRGVTIALPAFEGYGGGGGALREGLGNRPPVSSLFL